jgi:hypothetical protein
LHPVPNLQGVRRPPWAACLQWSQHQSGGNLTWDATEASPPLVPDAAPPPPARGAAAASPPPPTALAVASGAVGCATGGAGEAMSPCSPWTREAFAARKDPMPETEEPE